MSEPSYRVVPSSLFIASVRFLDLQVAAHRILSDLGHGLAPTGGMAGRNEAARTFASRYDPAAKSVSQGLARASQQLGGIADGLLAGAFNYLQAEHGSSFQVPQAFGSVAKRNDHTSDQPVVVPGAVGTEEQAEPDRLLHAAATWRQVDGLMEELSKRATAIVSAVANENNGRAVDAFVQGWAPMTALMSEVAVASRKLSIACESLARGHVAGLDEFAALAGTDATIESAIVRVPVIPPITASVADGVSVPSLDLVASIVPPGVALLFADGRVRSDSDE